jgi:ornithine carbamoyltransferase
MDQELLLQCLPRIKKFKDDLVSFKNEPTDEVLVVLERYLDEIEQQPMNALEFKTLHIASVFHVLNLVNKRGPPSERLQNLMPRIKRINTMQLKVFFSGELRNYNTTYTLYSMDFLMLTFIDLYDPEVGIEFTQ